ncbi:hypothetical protein [uncultured Pseudoteredinibacter sp.]|uniref:hypothetical protein n=1 Tax=uncultured Pseudoteredinibacter sp. TaxID=1641701 RepID=UPI00262EBE08|nr:hypothetical protein [uncultured Pseudoteredinibacter sp.]
MLIKRFTESIKLLLSLSFICLSSANDSYGAKASTCSASESKSSKKYSVYFANQSDKPIELQWLDGKGAAHPFKQLAVQQSFYFSSKEGHRFSLGKNDEPKPCFVIGNTSVQAIVYGQSKKLHFNNGQFYKTDFKAPFQSTGYLVKLSGSSSFSKARNILSINSKGIKPLSLRTLKNNNKEDLSAEVFEVKLGPSNTQAATPHTKPWQILRLVIMDSITEERRQKLAKELAAIAARIPYYLAKHSKQIELHSGEGWPSANISKHSFTMGVETLHKLKQYGVIDGTFFHEMTHIALDPKFRNDHRWWLAQSQDQTVISDYAMKSAYTEDLAESYLPYYLLHCLPETLSQDQQEIIQATIKYRMAFFTQHAPAICGGQNNSRSH